VVTCVKVSGVDNKKPGGHGSLKAVFRESSSSCEQLTATLESWQRSGSQVVQKAFEVNGFEGCLTIWAKNGGFKPVAQSVCACIDRVKHPCKV